MNLLLDLGNSRCKFALLENHDIKKYAIKPYSKADKLTVIASLLRNCQVLHKVIVCSVLGEALNRQLIDLLDSHEIHDYYFLRPAAQSFGIRLRYHNPAQLGADRLAAMIAANAKFSGNKCIIDCGTAITIDVLDVHGVHQGGVILPGFASMWRALSAHTNIQGDAITGNFNITAHSTQDAMYTGCLTAVAGGIQHAVNAMQSRHAAFDQIIITGGDADLILPLLSLDLIREPTLVLDGLHAICERP